MKKGKFTAAAFLFLQQFVDVGYVIERVVDEKLQFGNNAELESYALSQFETQGAHVCVDVCEQFLGAFGRENAKIGFANAQVGTYAAFAYRNDYAARCARLLLEYVAQFFLQKARYLVLSCGFH